MWTIAGAWLSVGLLLCPAANGLFGLEGMSSYLGGISHSLSSNDSGNELWDGLLRDCSARASFTCIQRNAYSYLDSAFIERDNITVFDGLVLTRNKLDYEGCSKPEVKDNLVEPEPEAESKEEPFEEQSPLEEITDALREKTAKFLATRDYTIQLPQFYFEGAAIKISPKEVDEDGALVRIDFGARALQEEGRIFIFKKIRKFIQNKLFTSLLALLLIIKLIKIKFMFIVPFLFGVGAAKKIFLKLLLFLVPAFAHVFKLCSSYYHSKSHHHHHQISHHHHHVPVPVPVPAAVPYYNKPPPHHQHHEEFDGYDYAHPHLQYRKDVEELREWGIEPSEEEPYPEVHRGAPVYPAPAAPPHPASSPAGYHSSGAFGVQQPRPPPPPPPVYPDKSSVPLPNIAAHNLAYSAYLDEQPKPANKRMQQQPIGTLPASLQPAPTIVHHQANPVVQKSQVVIQRQQQQQPPPPVANIVVNARPAAPTIDVRKSYDDGYYGPIIERLDEMFAQLKFHDEPCRERLVCSMYKNPKMYEPSSNIISNELSRDPKELKQGSMSSGSGQKFQRYLNAARLGQDMGDCLRTYPCQIRTE